MAEPTNVKTAEPAQPTAPSGGKKASADTPPPQETVNKMRRKIIWACVWGYLGVNFLMFLRYFFPRALYQPVTIFSIGYLADFKLGVDQRFLSSHRIWPERVPGRLFVILAVCTHLGCTPDWLPAQHIFHCPCHGSEYDEEGVNFAGPAPRPMDRCHVELTATGEIIVNKGVLFMDVPAAGTNHFNDPGAYIPV
jgi:cytochrome b6-f complex iron-sulfur subunit